MKTKIILTLENCPKLRKLDISEMRISIRLDDQCKNGHEDFAMTADGWYIGSNRRDIDFGGCCHDLILKVKPELQIFADLHLCSSKGVPMFAIANGFYHLSQKKFDYVKESLFVSDDELEILKGSADSKHFQYLLESFGMPERWAQKAKEGIKLLEQFTGETYTDHSTKETFIPLTEDEKKDIEQKIKSSFYSIENMEQRRIEKIRNEKNSLIEKLENEAKQACDKINLERDVKIHVLNSDLSINNFIFYNHTKTGVFNWKSYDEQITEEQFNVFLNKPRTQTFINKFGCSFQFGEKKK